MKSNIGKIERMIRILLGISLIVLGLLYFNSYILYTMLFIGLISLFTGFIGWCGMYSVCKISSNGGGIDRVSKKDIENAIKYKKIEKKEKSIVKKGVNKPNKKINSSTKKKTTSKTIKSKK